MARQSVTQIQCDRCKRVYLKPLEPEKIEPDFHAHFMGKDLSYVDLCDTCRRACSTAWGILEEWDREVKQSLLGPAVSDNQAPPLSVTPDYSPPKPHSAAGAKRS